MSSLTGSRNIRAIGYFSSVTIAVYTLPIILHASNPKPDLPSTLFRSLILFTVLYGLSEVFRDNSFYSENSSRYLDSFIHVLALLAIGNVIPVIVIMLSNTEQIFIDARPFYVDELTSILPFFAVIHLGNFQLDCCLFLPFSHLRTVW